MPGIGYMLLVDSSPAPASLLQAIQQVEVEMALDVASVFRLRIAIAPSDQGDWSVVEDDMFQPLTQVQVRAQGGGVVPDAIINGFVTHQEVTYGDDPGASLLEVTGMDMTAKMNLEEKVKAWPNLPDSVIAMQIFGQYQVVPVVTTTSPVLVDPQGTTIQRGSDIRFLRRLAARNGFDCYVQPESFSGLDFGYFGPPQLSTPAQTVLTVHAGTQSTVAGFRVRYEMTQPTTATAQGLDADTKSSQQGQAASTQLTPLGSTDTLSRIPSPPVALPAQSGLVESSDLQTLAQAVVDRSTWALVATGTVGPDAGVLKPGGIVNVRGAGQLYNGSYYLTRVVHIFGQDGYSQRIEARRNAVGATGAESFGGGL
jgi:hypothetical protein